MNFDDGTYQTLATILGYQPGEGALSALLAVDRRTIELAISASRGGNLKANQYLRNIFFLRTQAGETVLEQAGLGGCPLSLLIGAVRKTGHVFFEYLLPAALGSENHRKKLHELTAEQHIPAVEPPAKTFESVHVYGAQAAACFAQDQTSAGYHTIRIEVAQKKQGHFDWKNKIAIQLSAGELTQVYACLTLYLPRAHGLGHGRNREKKFSFERQSQKIYLNVTAGRHAAGVPITAGDLHPVRALFLRQLVENSPHLRASDIDDSVRASAALAAA